ncbi:class I SAM-dependent DNA methyltransferase [Rhodosalinus sp.]|uniref:class I SAM-dependent DNA methyltransferase n=1 Tax=Rhodosalinus sp. TaxID=2047741 RepID=UPI00397AC0F8
MNKGFLERVYRTEGAEEMRRLYDDWAESYDADLRAARYATPGRVAQALRSAGADPEKPLLDFGCGTGLSGEALAEAGFTTLDGVDVSDGMLEVARHKGVYRALDTITEDDAMTDRAGAYATVAAIGVIGSGAAPLAVLDRLWALLPSGGRMGFSFNDHTLQDPAYAAHVAALVDSGAAAERFREHGPHVPGEGVGALVVVLEKV